MNKLSIGIILFVIVGFYTSACQKDKDTIPCLKGTWVEIDTQTDTIVFAKCSASGSLLLKRGFETRNGYYLPKLGSGPYSYEVHKDSINLHWALSSSSYSRNYFFKVNERSSTFNIGVFTLFATGKAVLTFRKIG